MTKPPNIFYTPRHLDSRHLLLSYWWYNSVQFSLGVLQFFCKVNLHLCPLGVHKSNEQQKQSKICWSRLLHILEVDQCILMHHVGWAHTRECGQQSNPQLSWCPHLQSMSAFGGFCLSKIFMSYYMFALLWVKAQFCLLLSPKGEPNVTIVRCQH